MFRFARFGGYECSTKGDKRFSALVARLPDGRTIEEHYQCDVKGYQPGGKDWRLGKGKPPLNPHIDLYEEYKELWRQWVCVNPEAFADLRVLACENNMVLSDMFGTGPVTQARALADLLNQIPF